MDKDQITTLLESCKVDGQYVEQLLIRELLRLAESNQKYKEALEEACSIAQEQHSLNLNRRAQSKEHMWAAYDGGMDASFVIACEIRKLIEALAEDGGEI